MSVSVSTRVTLSASGLTTHRLRPSGLSAIGVERAVATPWDSGVCVERHALSTAASTKTVTTTRRHECRAARGDCRPHVGTSGA